MKMNDRVGRAMAIAGMAGLALIAIWNNGRIIPAIAGDPWAMILFIVAAGCIIAIDAAALIFWILRRIAAKH